MIYSYLELITVVEIYEKKNFLCVYYSLYLSLTQIKKLSMMAARESGKNVIPLFRTKHKNLNKQRFGSPVY